MTATEDRNARLASLQSNDPPNPDELVALQLKIDELKTSVEQLTSAQKNISESVGVLVATPLPPDNSSQIETLAAAVETLTKNHQTLTAATQTLANRPPHHADPDLSATLPALTEAVTSAVDATMSRAAARMQPITTATTAKEIGITEELREAMVTADKLTSSLNRTAWVRLALVAVPYTVVAVLLWLLVIPIAEVFGVGPLSRWAWASFETADTAWGRLGILAATLAVVAALGYVIYRGGRKLAGIYRDWR